MSPEKAVRYRNAGWTEEKPPVPDLATVPAVLDWVDEDPARAQVALASERSARRPRVTLINRLEQIADSDHNTPHGEEE